MIYLAQQRRGFFKSCLVEPKGLPYGGKVCWRTILIKPIIKTAHDLHFKSSSLWLANGLYEQLSIFCLFNVLMGNKLLLKTAIKISCEGGPYLIKPPKYTERAGFSRLKVCFGPKNLHKADHFEDWIRST